MGSCMEQLQQHQTRPLLLSSDLTTGGDGMEQLPSVWDHVPLSLLPLFVHHCVDRMCGRDGGKRQDLIPKMFADEQALETATGVCQHSLMQWIDIRDKNDMTISMDEERRKVISESLECRRPELRSAVVAAIVRSSGKGFLLDYDWRINYIFSSSKMSNINESVAIFTFSLSTGETCALDLSLAEMDMLLLSLKEIQSLVTD